MQGEDVGQQCGAMDDAGPCGMAALQEPGLCGLCPAGKHHLRGDHSCALGCWVGSIGMGEADPAVLWCSLGADGAG